MKLFFFFAFIIFFVIDLIFIYNKQYTKKEIMKNFSKDLLFLVMFFAF